MRDNSWIKVGFSLGEPDRRKVFELPMHEFILQYYQKAYGDKLFCVDECNERTVILNIEDATEEEVRQKSDELCAMVELSDASQLLVTDVNADKHGGLSITRVMDSYDRLIGVQELKELLNDIIAISETEQLIKLRQYFERCAICIAVGRGDGFTEYVKSISQVLKVTGVKSFRDTNSFKELKKNLSKEEMIQEYTSTYKPVCFDLTFMMEEAGKEEFRDFLRKLSLAHDADRLPIFRIPYVTGKTREDMLTALSAAFPLIFLEVPPFSTYQYLEYARTDAKKFGYGFDEEAIDELEALIVHERNRKHFYGFRSVHKLVGEIIYEKNLMEVRDNKEVSLQITEYDLAPLLEKYHTEKVGIETLDNMVGIDEVRTRVNEIVMQIEMSQAMPKEDRPCMHMIFTGNPGTGKTTVARLLGLVLKEKGLLSKGMFIERTGRDFVGKYIGETAPITNSICRDAYGSVLFIDEAYTLYRSNDDDRDFGREALDTLITQMENHRQDMVVIMAGYPDEMKLLMEANPGLRSRIPYEITFRNYKQDELAKIFMGMAAKKYECAPGLSEAVDKYFSRISDEQVKAKTFANARFVRNLYERTVTKAGLRIQAETGESIGADTKVILTPADFERATESEEFTTMQEKKKPIGFV